MRRLTERQRIAAFTLAILAALFLVLDIAGGSLRTARGGVRGAFGALYRGTDVVFHPVRQFLDGVPTAGSNQRRIEQLQAQNAQLRGQLAAQAADRSTAAQLHTLQLAATAASRPILPARVIALGPGEGFDWTVTIDVGRQDGVHDGQTVTDGFGLVGRVLQTDASTSVVLLAADPGSGVGVRDLHDGELGIATGQGASGLDFEPLNPGAGIAVGDQLVTGPVGGTSFVPGFTLGTVTAVRTTADGTTHATVRPAVSATTVDLVGVVDVSAADASTAARSPLLPAGR